MGYRQGPSRVQPSTALFTSVLEPSGALEGEEANEGAEWILTSLRNFF